MVDNNMKIKMVVEEADDGHLAFYRISDTANPQKLTSDPSDWVSYRWGRNPFHCIEKAI